MRVISQLGLPGWLFSLITELPAEAAAAVWAGEAVRVGAAVRVGTADGDGAEVWAGFTA